MGVWRGEVGGVACAHRLFKTHCTRNPNPMYDDESLISDEPSAQLSEFCTTIIWALYND